MAWVDKGIQSVVVWEKDRTDISNTKYQLVFKYNLRQDYAANKSEITTLGYSWKMPNSSKKCIYGTISVGIGIESVKKTKSFKLIKADENDMTNESLKHVFEVHHASDGSASFNLNWYALSSSSSTYAPKIKTYQNKSVSIQVIDRTSGNATISSVSIAPDTIQTKYKPYVDLSYLGYTIDGGETWVNVADGLNANTELTFSIVGLKPNTTYTIKYKQTRKYNNVSIENTKTVKTIDIPTITEITRTNISATQSTIKAIIDKTYDKIDKYNWHIVVYDYKGNKNVINKQTSTNTYSIDHTRTGYVIEATCFFSTTDGYYSNTKYANITKDMQSQVVWVKTEEYGWQQGITKCKKNRYGCCIVWIKTENGWTYEKQ